MNSMHSTCEFLLSTSGCRTHDEFISRLSRSLPMEQQVCCNLDALDESLSAGLCLAETEAVTIYWIDGEEASKTYEGGRILDILLGLQEDVDSSVQPHVMVNVILGAPSWAC